MNDEVLEHCGCKPPAPPGCSFLMSEVLPSAPPSGDDASDSLSPSGSSPSPAPGVAGLCPFRALRRFRAFVNQIFTTCERERVCVCVSESLRECEKERDRERESVCVCERVCMCESESLRECEKEREKDIALRRFLAFVNQIFTTYEFRVWG